LPPLDTASGVGMGMPTYGVCIVIGIRNRRRAAILMPPLDTASSVGMGMPTYGVCVGIGIRNRRGAAILCRRSMPHRASAWGCRPTGFAGVSGIRFIQAAITDCCGCRSGGWVAGSRGQKSLAAAIAGSCRQRVANLLFLMMKKDSAVAGRQVLAARLAPVSERFV
jgi:hypothetical protein